MTGSSPGERTYRRSAEDWFEGGGGAGVCGVAGAVGTAGAAQPPAKANHPAIEAALAHALYDRPMRDDAVLGDDDDAIANVIMRVVHLVRFACGRNPAVLPDARVLVDNRVFNRRVAAEADARQAAFSVLFDGTFRFVKIAAQHDGAGQTGAFLNDAAHADDAVIDMRLVDDAAVGNDGVIDLRRVDLGGRQKARAGENRSAHVEKIEPRQLRHQVQAGLEVRANRPHVLPVSLENKGLQFVRVDGVGNDVLAEVGVRVVQLLQHYFAFEEVNAHRGQQVILLGLQLQLFPDGAIYPQRILNGRVLGLLHESCDAHGLINLHDAEGCRLAARHRYSRHRDVRFRFHVVGDDVPEIHAIKLVATEDEQEIEIVVEEMHKILAHRVRRALVPRGV